MPEKGRGRTAARPAVLLLLLGITAACGCRSMFTTMPGVNSGRPNGIYSAAVGAYTQGMNAQQRGDWKQARECFASAHELDPDSMRVLVRLAVSTYEAGMPEEARPLLRRAEQAAGENPELALIIARFHARRADVNKSAEYYEIAAGNDNLLFTATREEARLFESAGDFDRAERTYVSLAEKSGRPLAFVLLGKYYARRKRFADALKQFRKIADNIPYVHGEIAVCRAEMGDISGALAALAEYAKFNHPCRPGDTLPGGINENHGAPWIPFLRVAEICISTGRPAEALEALQGASQSGGGDTVEIWELTGDALKAMNRRDDARDAWRRALELEPDEIDRHRIAEKLDSFSD